MKHWKIREIQHMTTVVLESILKAKFELIAKYKTVHCLKTVEDRNQLRSILLSCYQWQRMKTQVKCLLNWFILFDFLYTKLAGNWNIRITKGNCRTNQIDQYFLSSSQKISNGNVLHNFHSRLHLYHSILNREKYTEYTRNKM